LVTGSGAVDLTTDTGKLTAAVPAVSGLVGSGNDTVNVVSDGSSTYLGSPALSSITGGNTWLKVSLPKGTSSSDADTSSLAVLANPAQLLGLLSAVGGHVSTVGSVDLHGVPTTEYSTTVTLSELVSRAGLTTGSKLGGQVSKVLQQLGSTSVPITVWVGHDGYVRQISASLRLSKATLGSLAADVVEGVVDGSVATGTGGQSTTDTTVTVGFSHYNAPVVVAVPPASQTTDLNSIVHSVQGAFSGIGHAVSSIAARV
jgi:Flp pilus assembly pilin Flp